MLYIDTKKGSNNTGQCFNNSVSDSIQNKKGGDDLLSHWATPAVPSAPRDFTSVFGMGTGVALWLSSPPNKMVFE